jgi:hypothetical protein
MNDIKLTKAQREWLESLAENPRTCATTYRPHIALVKLGLAQTQRAPWLYSAITPAGRAWLAANPRRKK